MASHVYCTFCDGFKVWCSIKKTCLPLTVLKGAMASSTHLSITLFVAGVFSIFLDHLSVEGNNQQPSSAIEGQGSSYFFYQRPEYPRDCKEVLDSCSSSVSSGVYLIKPDGYTEPFEVYCDNVVDSGGWTSILRRFDGSVDFNRKWNDYKKGFGFLSTEFWLGNDKLSFLTNQGVYELRIDITLANSTPCDVQYDSFRISDEWSDYKISTVGTYKSDEVCRWEDSECDTTDCEPTDHPTNFTDCNDVYNAGNTQDGVYFIRPSGWNGPSFEVYCNMSIDGGSWTVFQRRVNGSTNFYRNWTEYRNGFGDVRHEFWLGNEKLHHLTNQATYEYRIDFVTPSTNSYYNKYTNFHVDNEDNNYRLANVGTRSGSAGYSLYNINNTPFSTHDADNDGQSHDCAEEHRSGWWHGAVFSSYSGSRCYRFPSGGSFWICSYANPNGDYNGGNGENIFDSGSNSGVCNQIYTELKIRRKS